MNDTDAAAAMPWIKICGMTTAQAVTAALQARVDAIGFVFAPSVRRVAPALAAQLAAPARGRVELVAVTLHPEQLLIDEMLREFQPDTLQSDVADFDALHLPATLGRLPVVRDDYVSATPACAQRVLFEGPRSGRGETADWTRAAQLARRARLILAGGLRADNVAAAIAAVQPYGVDVSSGVESEPGHKSPQKILQFVATARAAMRTRDPMLNP